MAITHQQHTGDGRQAGGGLLEPAAEGGELLGGIRPLLQAPEGPRCQALALCSGGLAGAGAGDQEQGLGWGVGEGSIEAVVTVEHHHKCAAAGRRQGRAK
jgi:hypothetical protein